MIMEGLERKIKASSNHPSSLSTARAAISMIFIATNIFCRDKLTFVATNTCFSRQNTSFVATKACLSRQIVCVCRDKYLFVATKMTLAAAPANDTAREELSYRSAMLLVKDRVVRQKGRRFVVCCIQPSSDS